MLIATGEEDYQKEADQRISVHSKEGHIFGQRSVAKGCAKNMQKGNANIERHLSNVLCQ